VEVILFLDYELYRLILLGIGWRKIFGIEQYITLIFAGAIIEGKQKESNF